MKSYRRLRIPGVFCDRNFSLFFSARLLSQFGDQLYAFAVAWYVLRVTQSSLQMAVPLVLNAFIMAVVAIFGGFIADRWNRKWIMVLTDVVQGIVLAGMALLLSGGRMQVWMIYLCTAVLALCGAVFSPAASAVIPDIVRVDLLNEATSANQFTISFCAMAGMLAGGAVYGASGMTAVLIFNAASNFLSALLESRLRIPVHLLAGKGGTAADSIRTAARALRAGFGYVKGDRVLTRLLAVNGAFSLISLPVGLVFIPYFFSVLLRADAMRLAIPQAALWLGMILSAVAMPRIMRRASLPALLSGGLTGLGLCTLAGVPLVALQAAGLLGADTPIFAWMVINFLCGASVNLFVVPLYALFQRQTPAEYRGRFWGIEQSVRTIALCSGYLMAGLMAETVPLSALFLSYALITLGLGFWVTRLKSIQGLGMGDPSQPFRAPGPVCD